MTRPETDVVIGAFSYTGRYIARRLLATGKRVVTLTRHPQDDPEISAYPLNFNDPAKLVGHLAGVTTLYNTYWVRFAYGDVSFDRAVANSRVLVQAARDAGVRRIVHVSIANASSASPLPYFRGKGLVEEAIQQSGLSYGILRPTLVFGREDVLVNNITWFLRRIPVFGVPGDGSYPVQPVYVDDLAGLAVGLGEDGRNMVIDAAGPETLSFEAMVRLLARVIKARVKILHLSPDTMATAASFASRFLHDVVLTRDEIDGLMAGLLISRDPPRGTTRFTEWIPEHAGLLGEDWRSELGRHYRL